jgi:uncharacterized protein YndB with AHSA1/START domain
MPTEKRAPVARIEQLIRSSSHSVFTAFTKPKHLKKFWLSKASAALERGQTVRWDFKVRGAKDRVKVLVLEADKRIRVQWSNGAITEWTFVALGRKKTLVRIEQSGFKGTSEEIVSAVIDTAQGFAFVLSDLKVLLEHGIRSRIVKDKASVIEQAMRRAHR